MTDKERPTANTEQREAFGRALGHALHSAGISGRALARALSLSPTSVSKWLTGKTVPPPHVVAQAERALGQAPGALSRALGYVFAIENPASVSVVDAARADPRLGPREQAVLLAVYRELIRQYANDPGSLPGS